MFGHGLFGAGKIGIHRTQLTATDYMANLEEVAVGPFEVVGTWQENPDRAFGNDEWFEEMVGSVHNELNTDLLHTYGVANVPMDDEWIQVPGQYMQYAVADVFAILERNIGPSDGEVETEHGSNIHGNKSNNGAGSRNTGNGINILSRTLTAGGRSIKRRKGRKKRRASKSRRRSTKRA
jgi:hypothetical protein